MRQYEQSYRPAVAAARLSQPVWPKQFGNRSHGRECFFHTVANSSWANFGYLVAAEIEGDKTLKALRMLADAHGIGVIEQGVDNHPQRRNQQ